MITEIRGYYILPVHFPGLDQPHYIFFKKHGSKEKKGKEQNQNGSDTLEDRSIFMFNLPINTDMSLLKKYFQTVAIGATIEFFSYSFLSDCNEDMWIDLTKLTSDLEYEKGDSQEKEIGTLLPRGCGIITFVDKAAFRLAFSSLKRLSSSSQVSYWPITETNNFGSQYLIRKCRDRILDKYQLTQEVAQSLVDFERAERESKEQLQNQSQIVDEDGFTLVVGSHRKTKAGIMGQQKLASTIESEKAQKKMKSKEKEDFYRFQLRERKKNEMNELLRKFKLDQQKVQEMKERRRFRPY